MKTFKTEKHNIPEGATHYLDESDEWNFLWLKSCPKSGWRKCSSSGDLGPIWVEDDLIDRIKPIPQTKEVEWDGEYQLEHGKGWYKYKVTYEASNGDMFAMCLVQSANNGNPFEQYLDSTTTKFRALESPEAKKECERIESAKYLYSKHCAGVRHPVKDLDNNPVLLNAWLVIVDETGYRVEK